MKITTIGLFALLILLTFPQFVFADDNIKTMAQIMLNLNHYPNASEKQTLRKITLDSATSSHEKTIANAIINLEHAATASDKKKLSLIIGDDSAPEKLRALASIVHNLNHKPSASDKKKLNDMM